MTKKDYTAVAQQFADTLNSRSIKRFTPEGTTARAMIDAFCQVAERDSIKFDRQKFVAYISARWL